MYDNATEKVKDEESKKESAVKLANVTALFDDGCPKIKFYGDDEPSEKEYSYLSTYQPAIGDIVLLAKTDNSYVIIGKINYKTAPSEDINIEDTIATYLTENNYVKRDADNTISSWGDNDNLLKKIKGETAKYDDVYVYDYFKHSGSYFGVFGATPVGKATVKSISWTAYESDTDTQKIIYLNDCKTKINAIIGCLKALGFVTN